ncbi:MAG: hypothetical protein IPI67_04175 [Myxococcales bacterium]|nr:hypothetical protein [Myxococcales bacterium]
MSYRHLFLGLILLFAAMTPTGCSPEPQYVSCRIDSECHEQGGKFRYCLMRKCVECVGDSGCGRGKSCHEGACRAD